MKLVFTMFLSIGVKALAAIIEILIQMLLTNSVGIAGYGDYTFFVSIVEAAYCVFFSGSIKANTFYLSIPTISISGFKKIYLKRFVVPILGIMAVICGLLNNLFGVLAVLILLLCFLAYDRSSVLFSRGHQLPALLGEYLIGRVTMLVGLAVGLKIDCIDSVMLFLLYGAQFAMMLIWFTPFFHRLKNGTEEVEVPIRKIWDFQQSDVALAIINYSSTILQYIFGGAFSAGFTGIIALVKKFTTFLFGPMEKIFLPEFSRLYQSNNEFLLQKSYLMIVHIQMMFIGAIGSALVGFPGLILKLFSPELQIYHDIFTIASVCFLLIASIGPATGFLQMTNNEKVCSRNQWISIGVMFSVWMIFRGHLWFAVYGLCAQAIVECGLKYYYVCKWFGKVVIPLSDYMTMWGPIAAIRVIVEILQLQYSLIALIISIILVSGWNLFFALRDPLVKEAVTEGMRKLRRLL